MINKIKKFVMGTNNAMFDTYIKYFSKLGLKIKLQRGGKIAVIAPEGTTIYDNWNDLNKVYKQLPIEEEIPEPTTKIQQKKQATNNKWYARGHKTRSKELLAKFCDLNNIPTTNCSDMNKPNWVYYIDSHKNFCATNNEMIIDLLESSTEWQECVLPDPIKLSKAQIAKMINMDLDSFIIV